VVNPRYTELSTSLSKKELNLSRPSELEEHYHSTQISIKVKPPRISDGRQQNIIPINSDKFNRTSPTKFFDHKFPSTVHNHDKSYLNIAQTSPTLRNLRKTTPSQQLTIDLGPYIPDKEKLKAFHKLSPEGSKERSIRKKHMKSASKREILDSYLKGHRGLAASAESF
jgi:hypothetical protein